jgi:hypothetical protein
MYIYMHACIYVRTHTCMQLLSKLTHTRAGTTTASCGTRTPTSSGRRTRARA